MMRKLWYHPESDCLFPEQYEVIDWSHVDVAEDVSYEQWAVERYNAEVPGYQVHLFEDRRDGLDHCLTCGGAECSLPTDCPGVRLTGEQQDDICAGKTDYWSGVWF